MKFKKVNPDGLAEVLINMQANTYKPNFFDLDNEIFQLDFSGIKKNSEIEIFENPECAGYFTFNPFAIDTLGEITEQKYIFTYDELNENINADNVTEIFTLCEMMAMFKIEKGVNADIIAVCEDEDNLEPVYIIINKQFLEKNYHLIQDAIYNAKITIENFKNKTMKDSNGNLEN